MRPDATFGTEMGLLDPVVAAGLVAACVVSVLLFPAVALALLARAPQPAEPVGGP